MSQQRFSGRCADFDSKGSEIFREAEKQPECQSGCQWSGFNQNRLYLQGDSIGRKNFMHPKETAAAC
jgi:hypothetical protein